MPDSRIEDHRFFPLLLVAASLAFSALAILRDPLVDEAGVLYLVVARNIAESGLAGAFELTARPLYPLLIAALHATGLPLLVAAQCLDAALLALLLVCFARLVATLGADARLAGWAALLLLMLPPLNAARSALLPESGYWALLFASWLMLLGYRHSRGWGAAFGWAALTLVAAGFNSAALVFALLLPLIVRVHGTPLSGALRLYACLAVLALAPLLVLARLGMLQGTLDGVFARAGALGASIATGFAGASARYATEVLGGQSDFAAASLAVGLVALLVFEFARALGVIHLGLLLWGIARNRIGLPEHARTFWLGTLLACALIVLALVLHRRFVAARDLLLSCMLALVPCALALSALAARARETGRHVAFGAALALAVVLLAAQGFISFGTRKTHLHEAIGWMDSHILHDASLFANDPVLAWYSGARFDWTALVHAEDLIGGGNAPLAGIDYWVIHDTGRHLRLDAALRRYAGRLEPLAEFDADDGKRRIRIFRVRAAGSGG